MAEENPPNGKEKFTTRFSTKLLGTSSDVIICNEGPGKGFASYPWALDRYERVLGLEPEEAWLIHRLIKHRWTDETSSFPSFDKICQEAIIGRTRLDAIRDSLLQKGYLSIAARGGITNRGNPDRKIRYSLDGLLTALTVAITCDPSSDWANTVHKDNVPPGALSLKHFFKFVPEGIASPAELNEYMHKQGKFIDWSRGEAFSLTILEKASKVYDLQCVDCHKTFQAKSKKALRCENCKEIHRGKNRSTLAKPTIKAIA